MKKVMLVVAAAAAMAGAGGAFAQSADCARGMLGHDPCGASGQVIPIPPNGGDARYDYRHYWPGAVLGAAPYGYGYQYPQVVPRYNNGTRHDRDGDGVRNNRDRHPDDPRYR